MEIFKNSPFKYLVRIKPDISGNIPPVIIFKNKADTFSGPDTSIKTTTRENLLVSARDECTIFQQRLIAELRLKINLKKKELTEFVRSKDGTKEEKMDLKRALGRIDNLLELPKSKILKNHPELLEKYVGEINKLLKLDPRRLNYVLACGQIITESDLENAIEIKLYEMDDKIDYEEKEKFIKEILPDWKRDTNNFNPNINDYFYLPGLPIVATTKLSSWHSNRFSNPNLKQKNDFSEKDIKLLKNATEIIVKSGWNSQHPETLQQVQSITLLKEAPFNGRAANGRMLVCVKEYTTPEYLSSIIIHEGTHKQKVQMFFESRFNELEIIDKKGKPDDLKHTWFGDNPGRVVSLLDELSSYMKECEFSLLVRSKENELGSFDSFGRVVSLMKNRMEAKKAIELIQKHTGYLDQNAKKIKEELIKEWGELSKQIKTCAKETISEYFDKEDAMSKEFAIVLATFCCTFSPEEKKDFINTCKKYIRKENNIEFLKHLLNDIDPDLRKRYSSGLTDEILENIKQRIKLLE